MQKQFIIFKLISSLEFLSWFKKNTYNQNLSTPHSILYHHVILFTVTLFDFVNNESLNLIS